jgi:hypothetical protein
MFCALRLIFGDSEGVGSRFNVLRSRSHFRRYRGRRVSFSCLALPNPFSAVPSASGPVFMFCAPGLGFGCTEGVGSCFLILCSRTRIQWCRARRVPFSCFALPNSVFGGTDGVGSRFHVLRTRTSFRRYRRRRVPFVMFCALRLDFGGTEGVGFRFHVLRSRTHFRR